MTETIRITLLTDKYDSSDVILAQPIDETEADEEAVKHENIEFTTEGTLNETDGRITIEYDDSELFDGEKTSASLIFDRNTPEFITMLRDGSVSAALVFENGKRHICVYRTQYMPFEICVRTTKIKNQLLTTGELTLDYLIEVHGVRTERTKMKFKITKLK